jgi:uncharacterized protein YceK
MTNLKKFTLYPIIILLLSGCTQVVTAPISIAGSVVGATVDVAGSAVGAAINIANSDDEDKKD